MSCGRLQQILDAIRLYHELGVWLEVTTLVISGLNDSEQELRDIAEFIYSVGPEVPWHVTQFYPAYKMWDRPPTPIPTLRRAREIGRSVGLRYVYEGNVPGEGGENTYCYRCDNLLISRYGFYVRQNRIRNSSCPNCGATIDGNGMSGDWGASAAGNQRHAAEDGNLCTAGGPFMGDYERLLLQTCPAPRKHLHSIALRPCSRNAWPARGSATSIS